jgi:hypothetical protein
VRTGLLAAGTKKFKRPPETSAGTARDYSTTFGAACKRRNHDRRLVYLSQGAIKRKRNSTTKTNDQPKQEFQDAPAAFGGPREVPVSGLSVAEGSRK